MSIKNDGTIKIKKSGIATLTAYKKEGKNLVKLDEKTIEIKQISLQPIVATKISDKINAYNYLTNFGGKVLSWSIPRSKEEVATIDEKSGIITVHGNGAVTITAQLDNGKKYKTKLNVSVPYFSKDEIKIKAGSFKKISLKNCPTGPETWKSSNPSIANVNEDGIVTAYHSGMATITALVDGDEYSCNINVVK